MARIRSHLSHNLVAYIALFFALSGGAYAVTVAPKDSVGTRSIRDHAVTKAKIHKRAISTSKFAPLATAPNAASLGGTIASDYQHVLFENCANGSAIQTIGSSGGVTCTKSVTAIREFPAAGSNRSVSLDPSPIDVLDVCHDGGQVLVVIQNLGGSSGTLNWLYSDGSTAVNADGQVLASGAEKQISFLSKRLEGQFIFANPAGVTTLNLHAFDAGGGCEMTGTAEFAPTS